MFIVILESEKENSCKSRKFLVDHEKRLVYFYNGENSDDVVAWFNTYSIC